jgi:hypothetical protein
VTSFTGVQLVTQAGFLVSGYSAITYELCGASLGLREVTGKSAQFMWDVRVSETSP